MTFPSSFSPAPHLRLVLFPDTCVVLNVEKGTVLLLSEEAGRIITHLRSVEGAAPPGSLYPAQEQTLVALVDAGVLIQGGDGHPWDRVRQGVPASPSWGTQDSPAALPLIPRAPLRWYVLGSLALLVVLGGGLGSRRSAFVRTRGLVQRTKTGTADHATAVRAAHAVRRTGRLLPLRVACWEEAAATTLALRWAGHRTAFRHGVATDPVRLHAWIEVGGRPVAESDDITDYTPFEEPDE